MFSKSLAALGLVVPVALGQIYGPAPGNSPTPTPAAAAASSSSSSASSSATSSANIPTFTAGVGGVNDLTFTPNSMNVTAGTVVAFEFASSNHSVAQSTFANPCEPESDSSFFAGFFPAISSANTTAFHITVNDTNPIWFYCPQTLSGAHHCNLGMVGVINPPANATQAQFVAAAKKGTFALPATIQGGTFTAVSSSSSGTSSPSASPSSSAVHYTAEMGFMSLVSVVFSALLSF